MPSKKIILAVIFFFLIVGLASLWKTERLSFKNFAKTDGEKLLSIAEPNPNLYLDSDGDGLMDWEELLWGTDPFNPDTDGDGTSDYDEIRMGRDPLKPGPDDFLPTDEVKRKTNESIESDLSETDKFARMFLAQYVASKERGDYKEGDYEKLLSFVLQPDKEYKFFKKTAGDFKTITTSETSLKNYGNTLSKIIKDGQIKYPASELVEMQKVLDGYENLNAENIRQASNRYLYLAEEFSKTIVPINLLINHVKMVNALFLISESVASMEFYLSDPARVMDQISLYPDSVEILSNTFKEIDDYFKNQNIKFSTAEDGYIFFSGL